jgi:hypothetical protein
VARPQRKNALAVVAHSAAGTFFAARIFGFLDYLRRASVQAMLTA